MEKKIEKALREVVDPELGINIVDLGIIYKIEFEKGIVKILMTLTSPGCPLAFVFEDLIITELKKIEGVKKVEITLTFDPPWSPEKLNAKTRLKLGI
jgi:metal-sulfur cluster biosynthetic enzyme